MTLSFNSYFNGELVAWYYVGESKMTFSGVPLKIYATDPQNHNTYANFTDDYINKHKEL